MTAAITSIAVSTTVLTITLACTWRRANHSNHLQDMQGLSILFHSLKA